MGNTVQVLGLRLKAKPSHDADYTDKTFFKENWGADSVEALFENLDAIVAKIPENERWNMYYTACVCYPDEPRKFFRQDVLPIDIDDIDLAKVDDYIAIVCKFFGVTKDEIIIVFSGNGLQFILHLQDAIVAPEYFINNRVYYKAMCGELATELFNNGLIGTVDTSVFSSARLLRLPNTENRKKNKGVKQATLISKGYRRLAIDMKALGKFEDIPEHEMIHPKAAMRLPAPDTEAVQNGCEFLKHCFNHQSEISEPAWYAMLSIIGRLENGHELAHRYSERHPRYNPKHTDSKTEHAVNDAGPRTCDSINTLWDGCRSCPHYGKIKSPILIRGESYIRTKDTGFWNTVVTKDGEIKVTQPNYDDLLLHYDNLHEHRTIRETSMVYQWTSKHWKLQEKTDIHSFTEMVMEPKPMARHCEEFEKKLKRTSVEGQDWLEVHGKINLWNGVMDVETGAFLPHDKEYGFPYVLPYEYDPDAKCPMWEKFIDEVTLNRKELVDVLQEFIGYCLSYLDPAIGAKAMILMGSGANGKSVCLYVLRKLLGEDNFSAVNIGEAVNKDEQRTMLLSKMANITEETPKKALMDSTMFKDLVTGGTIPVRKLYHGSFQMKNMAKIIMACNEAPYLTDLSEGTRRRLIVVPFDQYVPKESRDPFLARKLEKEISGIFNWAMIGLRRLKANNYMFTEGEVVENTLDKIQDESSAVAQFIQENFEVDMDCEDHHLLSDLYDLFVTYAGNEARAIGRNRFYQEILSYLSRKLKIRVEKERRRYGEKTGNGVRFLKPLESLGGTRY